jgi:hypothetical protein
MLLSEIKSKLPALSELVFLLPDGSSVPAHFHITEVGQVNKRFIDCGGTVREEKVINFQLWEDMDYDHRLGARKLLEIIELSERVLELENLEIEVEYQGDTIGKYGLEFKGERFLLTKKLTDCLAKDKCGIPVQKPRIRLSELQPIQAGCCTPNSGCC